MKRVIETVVIDRNIYYNPGDPGAAEEYLEWAREFGREKRSVQGDPKFVDVESGNFALKPDSPALELGFRPFELNAGRIEK